MKKRSYAVVLAVLVALMAASGASARHFARSANLAPTKVVKVHAPDVHIARRVHRDL